MKLRTRRLRFMPMARSIPSSGFRSSASITKMFTSSRIPAMIEKLPMNRNIEPSALPASSAASSSVFLGASTAVPPAARDPRVRAIVVETPSE